MFQYFSIISFAIFWAKSFCLAIVKYVKHDDKLLDPFAKVMMRPRDKREKTLQLMSRRLLLPLPPSI